ncbi:MAG: hypothetical protein ABSC46_03850 [Candidatus Limnocylindrales bacterium]|jgi:hypothetical protein
MDDSSVGPLAFWQKLFWLVAIAMVVGFLLLVVAITWPPNFCGGSC